MSQATDQQTTAEPFVAYLEDLRDTPYRARTAMYALRRAVGRNLADARPAWPYVMPWLSRTPQAWRDDCHLTLAALFASHQLSWTPGDDYEGSTNLGVSLALLRRYGEAERIDRLMGTLLSADRDMFRLHRLPTAIRLLAQHRVPVDWSTLLRDMLYWWPEGTVARRWSRVYYALPGSQEKEIV